jgi:small subunit ribosomal protein S20
MPIIKSAKKRVKVAAKQSTQNSKTKRSLRNSIKSFHATLTAKRDTTTDQNKAYSAIDTAVKKGIISKNKAARKKSQLNRASKATGTSKPRAKKVKTAPSEKPASKATVTKKKSPAKKSVAKKAPAKKK